MIIPQQDILFVRVCLKVIGAIEGKLMGGKRFEWNQVDNEVGWIFWL